MDFESALQILGLDPGSRATDVGPAVARAKARLGEAATSEQLAQLDAAVAYLQDPDVWPVRRRKPRQGGGLQSSRRVEFGSGDREPETGGTRERGRIVEVVREESAQANKPMMRRTPPPPPSRTSAPPAKPAASPPKPAASPAKPAAPASKPAAPASKPAAPASKPAAPASKPAAPASKPAAPASKPAAPASKPAAPASKPAAPPPKPSIEDSPVLEGDHVPDLEELAAAVAAYERRDDDVAVPDIEVVIQRLNEAHPELLPVESLEAACKEGSVDRAGKLLRDLASKKGYKALERVSAALFEQMTADKSRTWITMKSAYQVTYMLSERGREDRSAMEAAQAIRRAASRWHQDTQTTGGEPPGQLYWQLEWLGAYGALPEDFPGALLDALLSAIEEGDLRKAEPAFKAYAADNPREAAAAHAAITRRQSRRIGDVLKGALPATESEGRAKGGSGRGRRRGVDAGRTSRLAGLLAAVVLLGAVSSLLLSEDDGGRPLQDAARAVCEEFGADRPSCKNAIWVASAIQDKDCDTAAYYMEELKSLVVRARQNRGAVVVSQGKGKAGAAVAIQALEATLRLHCPD